MFLSESGTLSTFFHTSVSGSGSSGPRECWARRTLRLRGPVRSSVVSTRSCANAAAMETYSRSRERSCAPVPGWRTCLRLRAIALSTWYSESNRLPYLKEVSSESGVSTDASTSHSSALSVRASTTENLYGSNLPRADSV